jgi:hypothetical protein
MGHKKTSYKLPSLPLGKDNKKMNILSIALQGRDIRETASQRDSRK